MHTIPPEDDEYHTRDRYWRLHALHDFDIFTKGALRGLLEKDGCKIRGSKEDFQNASLRLQCGRTNYESCEDSELRRFEVITRKVLIDLLKTADDQQTFDKFQDLPPEVRERIAKYYLREFSSTLIFPTQPPLARTGRLVRKEVLTLFYQRCTFELHYEMVPGREGDMKPCSHTLEWLYSLAPAHFSSMRNLELNVRHEDDDCDTSCDFRVTMQLGAPSSKYYQLHIIPGRVPSRRIERKMYRAELDKVLKSIVYRKGGKFEQNDLYLFRNAIKKGKEYKPKNV